MSDVFWTAFFIFAGTCVTLFATWIQTRTVKAQTARLAANSDAKSDIIHNLVNSKMSAALQEIDRLKGVVEALQRGEAHP